MSYLTQIIDDLQTLKLTHRQYLPTVGSDGQTITAREIAALLAKSAPGQFKCKTQWFGVGRQRELKIIVTRIAPDVEIIGFDGSRAANEQ